MGDLITCCEVLRMPEPLWLSIAADVQGLSVTFETPKFFDLDRYVSVPSVLIIFVGRRGGLIVSVPD